MSVNKTRIRPGMRTKYAGFSLLEVLIAMLILSVGVTGMMAVQANGKKASFEAIQRSSAAAYAQDIIERMRANNSVLSSYDTGTSPVGGSTKTLVDCGSSATCGETTLASYDIYQWERSLDGAYETVNATSVGGLSNPSGCITHSSGVVTVAVAWRGSVDFGSPTISSCGEGRGLYGASEEYRQVLVITTYIGS